MAGRDTSSPTELTPVLDDPEAGIVVARGAALTIGAGVVKVAQGLGLQVEGKLVLEGTSSTPLTITSATDDSVGGKARPESQAPVTGTWTAVGGYGGEVDVQRTSIRYADSGVVSLISGTTTSIVDSEFAHDRVGVVSGLPVSVTHSVFRDGGERIRTYVEAPTIADNAFIDMVSWPVTLMGGGVDLDLLHGNTATDSAHPVMEFTYASVEEDGEFPTGPAGWNPSGAAESGVPVSLTPQIDSPLVILPGVNVTMGPGAMKFGGSGMIEVQGSLTIGGMPTAPAVLTSEQDNAVGTPIAGGGIGQVGAWNGVTWQNGSHVSVSNAVFRGGGLTAADNFNGAQDPATLSNVEFASTTKAIDATSTGGCGDPFGTLSVTGSGVWFGATGVPGGLAALSSVSDPGGGDATYDEAKAAYQDADSRYGALDNSVADNTIPFADWTCADWSFPVTPIHVDLATTAPFPDYAQK